MIRITSALIVAILTSTPALAGFINNKSSWDKLPDSVKAGYVMGIWDELTTEYWDEPADVKQRKDGFRRCASDSEFDAEVMINIINKEYDDLKTWSFPPNLYSGLCKVCRNVCK